MASISTELIGKKRGSLLDNPVVRMTINFVTSKWFIFGVFLLMYFVSLTLFAKYEFIEIQEINQQFEREGKNPYFEAAYWLITTATTVGYGDITPQTFQGKIVSIFMMILGVSVLGLVLSTITSKIVSSNIGSLLGIGVTKGKTDYIICGWDKVAEEAFKELDDGENQFVIVDSVNRPELSHMKNVVFILGDPLDKQTLIKANIKNAKSVLLSMQNDADIILSTHIIRDLNPWINIVAEIDNRSHIPLAQEAGADRVVSPSSIGGRLLSIASEEPNVVRWLTSVLKIGKNIDIVEYDIKKDSPWNGKTIGSIRPTLSGRAKILGVDTAEGLDHIPSDNVVLHAGNKVIMILDRTRGGPVKR